MPPSRTPGQRAGLTAAAVHTAARALLAEQGLDGLSMRAIAKRLDVAPNALYSHVPNKTALLDDLLDEALAEVVPPAADADPGTGLYELMAASYRVLLEHADLVPLYLARQGARGPNARRLGEVMEALLVRAGLREPALGDARRVLIVHTIGFAAFAAGTGTTAEQPFGREAARHSFSTGLRWLVAGILSG